MLVLKDLEIPEPINETVRCDEERRRTFDHIPVNTSGLGAAFSSAI